MRFTFLILIIMISQMTLAQSKREICRQRKAYKNGFLNNEHSPLKKSDIKYLRFYEPNLDFVKEATFSKIENGKVIKMGTSSGKTKEYLPYGRATFEHQGKKHSLTLFKSIALSKIPKYKDYLFVPFRDLTSGESTYGAGRYIDVKTTDIKDGKITINFNTAYNPYCAFSDGYSCPIPPKENSLELAIEAGEKNFAKIKE